MVAFLILTLSSLVLLRVVSWDPCSCCANLLLGAGIGYETQCRKIKSIIISRSRTIFPPHLDLFILDDLLENVEHLKPLGVILDPRLTFASKHLVIFCTYQTYAPMTVMF